MTTQAQHVAIIGAGVVGTATALALLRDGHQVTLIDRNEPGSGASFGNSGFIHTGGNIPLASPGIVRAAIKMAFDEESPLVVRFRYLPQLLPWIVKFARRSKPELFLEDAKALNELTSRAVPAWKAVARATRADGLFGARGELFLYRDPKKFDASREEFALRKDMGVDIQEVSADEIRQMEPGISRDIQHGWYLADSMFTTSPHRLTRFLAAAVIADGGRLENFNVTRLTPHESGVTLSGAGGQSLDVDRVVLAAGAHSKGLARQAGAKVPLQTLRGYHVMLPPESAPLKGPIMDAEKKFGMVPMQEGIRIAGMLELAGFNMRPSAKRANVLHRLGQRLLPDLPPLGKEQSRWLGHRPGIPDSRPVIGPAPDSDRVIFAFGHGTIGLTLAAVTGDLVADLVAGRDSGVDLSLFSAERFDPPPPEPLQPEDLQPAA